MTSNQSNQLVKNPNTKKALESLQKFAALELEYKATKAAADKATETIKEAMIANNVQRLDGDWGYITLAERTNYSAEDISKVGADWIKPSLDTTKIKATQTLTGILPVGITESKTQYITKKFKAVE